MLRRRLILPPAKRFPPFSNGLSSPIYGGVIGIIRPTRRALGRERTPPESPGDWRLDLWRITPDVEAGFYPSQGCYYGECVETRRDF